MVKRLSVACVLFILLGVAMPVAAQGPVDVQHSDPTWHAQYWNDLDLGGSPAVEREDANIDFDWGTGSPDGAVGADTFSARWTRTVSVSPGTYDFAVTSDDGIRVWIDGVLLLDRWYDHSVQTFHFSRYLGPEHHHIKVEYYENGGFAVAKLSWTRIEGDTGGWRGEYFNNMTLSGAPALVRYDADVNFDWGSGSPGYGVVADHFSARWTRTLHLSASRYRFSLTIDDGARLWVNGQRVIDEWRDQSPTTFTGEIDLPGGATTIELEYYEDGGGAVAKLSWIPVGPDTGDWDAEYFNNMHLGGSPALTRQDSAVDFDWGTGSPGGGVNHDQFSARWQNTVSVDPGTYRFSVTVDDGARLWVNGHLLIDVWYDQEATTHSADMYLSGGSVTLKLEYYEHGGYAVCRFWWSGGGGAPPAPWVPGGTVIVDDRDAGFVKGGSASGWRYVAEGHNGTLTWTRNNDYARYAYNWARWYPHLQARYYEVFVYIPFRYTTTARARYWVRHANGYTLRIVDQSLNGDRWVSLGTYWFTGSGSDYASLSDVTYEPRVSRLIGFDAVKWEPR
jgi:hypothetical protein